MNTNRGGGSEEEVSLRRDSEQPFQRLIELTRDREEFVGILSHELRTPLTSIVGWADLLRKRQLSEDEVRKYAEVIARNAKRLWKAIDALVRVASIRWEFERTLQQAPVDLTKLLDEPAARARDAGRHVAVSVEREAEWAMAHESYLADVLNHLLDNALKFTRPRSPIDLKVRREREGLIFQLADHGPGVAEEDRERIFRAFVQGESGMTRRYEGLGLGLYICRESIRAHGGRIWLEDTAGGGATFLFTIPQGRQSDQLPPATS